MTSCSIWFHFQVIARYSEDVEEDELNSLLGLDKGESTDFDKPKKKKSGGKFRCSEESEESDVQKSQKFRKISCSEESKFRCSGESDVQLFRRVRCSESQKFRKISSSEESAVQRSQKLRCSEESKFRCSGESNDQKFRRARCSEKSDVQKSQKFWTSAEKSLEVSKVKKSWKFKKFRKFRRVENSSNWEESEFLTMLPQKIQVRIWRNMTTSQHNKRTILQHFQHNKRTMIQPFQHNKRTMIQPFQVHWHGLRKRIGDTKYGKAVSSSLTYLSSTSSGE